MKTNIILVGIAVLGTLAAVVTPCLAVEAVAGDTTLDEPGVVADPAPGPEGDGRRSAERTRTPVAQAGTLLSCWQRGTKVLSEQLGKAAGPTPAGALALERADGRRWVVLGVGDALCLVVSDLPAAARATRDAAKP